MKKAFTMIEIMIVVAILGILSAITVPLIQDHVTKAREANAAGNLRELRNAIELFSIKNGKNPGYNSSGSPTEAALIADLVNGGYLPEIPENPFNNFTTIQIVADAATMPSASPGGRRGWVYKAKTKEIRMDWKGNDTKGLAYFKY